MKEYHMDTFQNHILVKERGNSIEDRKIQVEHNLRPVVDDFTGNDEIYNFIDDQISLATTKRVLLSAGSKTFVNEDKIDNLRAFINLNSVNSTKNVKGYLRAVNKLLPDTGLFVGCVETYDERKQRFKNKFNKFWKIAYTFDFVVNRVIPRLKGLDKVYSYFTKDAYHVMSKAEILGRLVHAGFDIIDFSVLDGKLYYVAMKTKEPSNNSASFHPLFKMMRIGKNNEMIGVYKMRTMHPYSEYLQSFVVKLNGYNEVGKPANDFRVTSWGKVMRKLWLDEIPQFINVILGQMKLVGVRPLSKARFSELPEEVQHARVNHKPGCFPPYVALCMPDENQNIEAEVIYMKDKSEHPYITDIKYLVKSAYNILTNKIRSA